MPQLSASACRKVGAPGDLRAALPSRHGPGPEPEVRTGHCSLSVGRDSARQQAGLLRNALLGVPRPRAAAARSLSWPARATNTRTLSSLSLSCCWLRDQL